MHIPGAQSVLAASKTMVGRVIRRIRLEKRTADKFNLSFVTALHKKSGIQLTPKALASSSPGLELSDNPGIRQ
jgi:hypothetical protein